jgi:hypothetical protein
MVVLFEHGSEPLGSLKSGEFMFQVKDLLPFEKQLCLLEWVS